MNKGPHYVYYLYDVANMLAYIGRSIKPEIRRSILQRKFKETFTLQLSLPIEDLDNACDAERAEIDRFRPRLNTRIQSTRGCFGISINKGVPKSAAQIANLTGPGNGMYGKHHTESTRRNMSAASLGKPKSARHRANMAAANRSPRRRRAEVRAQWKDKPMSEAHRASIKAALNRPETRRKLSIAGTGRKDAPETVAKRAASNTGKKRTPEQIARMCEAQQTRLQKLSGWGHPWRLASLDQATQQLVEAY